MKSIDIFIGKGGVGKTTLASAYALLLSESKNTLLLSIKSSTTLEHLFDEKLSGLTPLAKNLYSKDLEPMQLMDSLIQASPALRKIAKPLTSSKLYRAAVKDFPMTREFLLLREIFYAYTSSDFDAIVVDAPATGHGISFLDTPQRLDSIVQGELKTRIGRLREILYSESTKLHIVTLAEEMPVRETFELYERPSSRNYHVRALHVNKLLISPIEPLDVLVQGLPVQQERTVREHYATINEQQSYLKVLSENLPEVPLKTYSYLLSKEKLIILKEAMR